MLNVFSLSCFVGLADAAAGGDHGGFSRRLFSAQYGVSSDTDPPGGGAQHKRHAAHPDDTCVR